MKKNSIGMLTVLFICGAMTVMTSCSKDDENQSNNEVENTLEETQSFNINKAIEGVIAHLAEVNFQDLALLNIAIKDSSALVYCVDHDSIGINKICDNYSINKLLNSPANSYQKCRKEVFYVVFYYDFICTRKHFSSCYTILLQPSISSFRFSI